MKIQVYEVMQVYCQMTEQEQGQHYVPQLPQRHS